MAKALQDFVHGGITAKRGENVEGLHPDVARQLEEHGLIQGKMAATKRANKSARGPSENKGNAPEAGGDAQSSASPAAQASRGQTSTPSKRGGKRGRKSGG